MQDSPLWSRRGFLGMGVGVLGGFTTLSTYTSEVRALLL